MGLRHVAALCGTTSGGMTVALDAVEFLERLGLGGAQWAGATVRRESERTEARDIERSRPDPNPSELPEPWRELYEERAGIKEFCANMPRAQAEREAWEEILKQMKKSP